MTHFENSRFLLPAGLCLFPSRHVRRVFMAASLDGGGNDCDLASLHANPEAARLRRARMFYGSAQSLGGEMNPHRPRVPSPPEDAAEWNAEEEDRQWAACFAWGDREMAYDRAHRAQLGVRT